VPTSLDDETIPALPPEPAAAPPAALTAPPQLPALTAGTAAPSTGEPDAICAGAVTLARQAALEVAGAGQVGDHVGVEAEGERVVTHQFACLGAGYRGWRWAVTVARAPRARTATVSEVVLLPGPGSVLAPVWLPWSDRIAPGDLGASDQLPYRVDDPNLEPGYTLTDDEEADRVALWELGLGRPRVLSPPGRSEVARRWYASDRGPTSDEAVHAAAACSSCGYFLPMAGALRQVFGVCGNEWSPSDARVVSVDHGCGAHSETDVERPEAEPLPPPILDETGYEAIVLPTREAPTVGEVGAEQVPEPALEQVAETPDDAPVEAPREVAEAPAEAVPAPAEAMIELTEWGETLAGTPEQDAPADPSP